MKQGVHREWIGARSGQRRPVPLWQTHADRSTNHECHPPDLKVCVIPIRLVRGSIDEYVSRFPYKNCQGFLTDRCRDLDRIVQKRATRPCTRKCSVSIRLWSLDSAVDRTTCRATIRVGGTQRRSNECRSDSLDLCQEKVGIFVYRQRF